MTKFVISFYTSTRNNFYKNKVIHTVKNNLELVSLSTNDIIIPLDVSNLFTNVPVVPLIKNDLKTFAVYFPEEVNEFMNFSNICLGHNFVNFDRNTNC